MTRTLGDEAGEMLASDVLTVVGHLETHGIDVVVDGGWGVDALIGHQTRTHGDLDIAVEHRHVATLRELLGELGYRDLPQPETRDYNFVLGDASGHLVDVHSYTFDTNGVLVFGIAYPPDSLAGQGLIAGRVVRCITPDRMVQFHTGYEVDDDDYRDVLALCTKFGLAVPADYHKFYSRCAD